MFAFPLERNWLIYLNCSRGPACKHQEQLMIIVSSKCENLVVGEQQLEITDPADSVIA